MKSYRKYNFREIDSDLLKQLCRRPAAQDESYLEKVRDIVRNVKEDGDQALRRYTQEFDGVRLESVEVTKDELKHARLSQAEPIRAALKQARDNITKFHKRQSQRNVVRKETMPGVSCFVEARPIEKVGLYVPGGTAPLPSTVLMLAIPARLAKCKEIFIATPPNADGEADPSILYAALLCGVKRIFKVGGAQAIAALAYGTETVPKVDKIFGPGNRYVAAAKAIVAGIVGGPAVDMPAGPSEVLVIADSEARADFVAGDLLSQAEHGAESQVVLVTTSGQKADSVFEEIKRQLETLPRSTIVRKSLEHSFAVVVGDLGEAVEFANAYAPEHLIINTENAGALVPKIMNAGSVFLGPYSCEAAGDYASGPNHTLPTYGHARAYSGISVASFQKRITFQEVTRQGARNLAPIVTKLAELEGLDGHKLAMEMRVETAEDG